MRLSKEPSNSTSPIVADAPPALFTVTPPWCTRGMDAELERRLARRAASQSGLVSRRQLVAIGFTDHQIKGRVANGRLRALHRGIYLLGGAPLTDLVRLQAATLATNGVASHRSAAHIFGLVDVAPTRPEITIDAAANSRGPFIAHRCGDLQSRDTISINGVATTNATRTLVDLGAVVHGEVLEAALESTPAPDHNIRSIVATFLRTRCSWSPRNCCDAFASRGARSDVGAGGE